MFDLERFTLTEMTRCGIELRKLGAGASSLEGVADRTVRYLYDSLGTSNGEQRACALVRLFVTMPFSDLGVDQQSFVRSVLPGPLPSETLKCLTLMGTAGTVPSWNSPRTSAGHMALPLTSEESVARSPMIARLIHQLGIETRTFLEPEDPFLLDSKQHTFNVFHVAEAEGSPYIPAQQDFVKRYGVRSVLGFGGRLPAGELFATVLFSQVPIPRVVADLFKTLALNVKVAMLPFVGRRVFE